MKYLHVELKVCEGCGVLWLRPQASQQVYCTSCSSRLSQFPQPRPIHAGGRPRRGTRVVRRCQGEAR